MDHRIDAGGEPAVVVIGCPFSPATATGRHVTTVRFHLDLLIEAGLVTAGPQEPHGRGRPRTVYAAAFHDGGAPGGSCQELADLLAAHFDTTPARRGRRAERAGAAWAARRLSLASGATPSPASSSAEARRRITGMFAEMGFDPECVVTVDEPSVTGDEPESDGP
jgi:predicted ArsR family transcriptional regulator